jgi:exopolyphosphatase
MLNTFLARSHARFQDAGVASTPTVHVVLGNEAADPDSCVCAIAIAAALDVKLRDEADTIVAPMILVPRADFKLQLDRVHLLRRAGLAGTGDGPAWTPTHVSFADEVELAALAARGTLHVHLVDHNKLAAPYSFLAPHVSSIVDHHAEEGLYTESVAADARHVELGIGSCASLVVERLAALAPPLLHDGALASLLLGAILLDTVNLDPSAKPQKPREADVAKRLLEVAAGHLTLTAADGSDPDASAAACRAAFFDELIRVKGDVR